MGGTVEWTELGRWVLSARTRLGTRREAVQRANAAGGKVSYDTWRKVERLAEGIRPGDDTPSNETLRAIGLGLGIGPDALIAWRHGGPEPAMPERLEVDTASLYAQLLEEMRTIKAEIADLRRSLDGGQG